MTEEAKKSEAQAKTDAVKAQDDAREQATARTAKKKDRSDVDRPTDVVLKRRAFINGRLYEAGETVTYLPGVGAAKAPSTPIGNLSDDELEAELEARRIKRANEALKAASQDEA